MSVSIGAQPDLSDEQLTHLQEDHLSLLCIRADAGVGVHARHAAGPVGRAADGRREAGARVVVGRLAGDAHDFVPACNLAAGMTPAASGIEEHAGMS